jgi:hypothetical protein
VIAAKPVHQLIVAEAPVWLIEEREKWQRAFFWAGKKEVNLGQCLVAWQKISLPNQF